MVKAHANLLVALLKMTDMGILVAAWLVALAAESSMWSSGAQGHFRQSVSENLAWIAFSIPASLIVFSWLGAYDPRRLQGLPQEARSIAWSVAFCWGLIYLVADFARPSPLSQTLMASFLISWMAAALSWRLAARGWLRSIRRRGLNLRHAAIVGTGRIAQKLYHTLSRNVWTGVQVSYFVSEGEQAGGLTLQGRPILGPMANIAELLRAKPVDIVFVAVRHSCIDRIEQVFADLTTTATDVYLVPDILPLQLMRDKVIEIGGLKILGLTSTPLRGWNTRVKRVMDILLGCGALALFALPMALIALLVKAASRGPVLYSQERASLGGHPFRMMKFRTMVENAESATGPVWTSKDDHRVTRIGRLLRKTSLDELPQLFNVLRGDMSLIGPRPERPELIEQFRQVIPQYMLRHHVKAGMTGLAQVRGWRGNTSLRKRIQYDLYYIRNWSIWLDAYVLGLTAFRGFVHPYAY